jgi:hypothetical protein
MAGLGTDHNRHPRDDHRSFRLGRARRQVTITNIETQLTRATRTSAEGICAFTLLPVGNYKLHVEGSGFKTLEQTGITLSINQVWASTLPLRSAL